MNDLQFFDTETINNKTVLICSSENFLWNSKGLNADECLSFLVNNAKKYNYFFRIDYDINMIIKGIPKKNILELFETNETKYKSFKIQYFRHKILIINNKKFYDIANFFQTSLIRNIEILQIDLTDEEKRFVEYMKRKRENFRLKDKQKIIRYSLLENQIGLKIVKKIYSLIPDSLKTYSLYGSSSLANKFLKNKVKSSFLFSTDLFKNAYFGGRMEVLKIGTFKNVFKYDINSAYPDIIKDLREPISFEIKKYFGEKIKDENIYQISFNHIKPNQIGCFPVRLKCGYLVFPKSGEGYYFGCEVKEGIKRGVRIKIKNVCDIKLGNKIFSKNEIEEMYKLRLRYKKQGDLKNLIYKILLNSIYGKFAQTVGKAQFQNIYFAGYITAQTRAKLLQATFKNDEHIIFFATDGILSKKKLKLKIGSEIGQFEEIKIKNAVIIQAGIYKLTDENNKTYLGERGFRFNFDEAIKQIRKGKTYKVKLKTFISNIYAYKNYKALLKYRCKFTTIEKELNIKKQHKRIFKTFDIDSENNSLLLNKIHINKLNKTNDMFEFIDVISNDFDILIL